jgi:hypothetical protein
VQRVSKPFPPLEGEIETVAKLWGRDIEWARMYWDAQNRHMTFWEDDVYQVAVKRVLWNGPSVTHQIRIRRRDGGVASDHWKEFMRIKNLVLGPEWEAVELYPNKSRAYDTSNTYWLWASLSPFPFGYYGLEDAEDSAVVFHKDETKLIR